MKAQPKWALPSCGSLGDLFSKPERHFIMKVNRTCLSLTSPLNGKEVQCDITHKTLCVTYFAAPLTQLAVLDVAADERCPKSPQSLDLARCCLALQNCFGVTTISLVEEVKLLIDAVEGFADGYLLLQKLSSNPSKSAWCKLSLLYGQDIVCRLASIQGLVLTSGLGKCASP